MLRLTLFSAVATALLVMTTVATAGGARKTAKDGTSPALPERGRNQKVAHPKKESVRSRSSGKAKASSDKASTEAFATQPAWCAPEVEALPNDVCFIDGLREGKKRTLVIYLHGVIAKNTTWQWTQERAILRQAKQNGFAAIVPQAPAVGPDGSGGFAWHTAKEPSVEQELVDGWSAARRLLEARSGHPFDEVFVVGFSSGAYYATSLALRGKLDVDGYVVLAGGAVMAHRNTELRSKPPIFVGVSARDAATAPGARALGGALSQWGWQHRVDEEPVGHMVSDVHMAHALAYLRAVTVPTSSSSLQN